MFQYRVFLAFAQVLLLVGSTSAVRRPALEPAQLTDLRKSANNLYAAGSFQAASDRYTEGYQLSLSSLEWSSAKLFLINLGSARFAMFQYQSALDAYLKAKRLAEDQNDQTNLGAIWSNLSSLYMQVGDLASAHHAAEQGLHAIDKTRSVAYRGQLLAQLGLVLSREGHLDQGVAFLRQAIDVADRYGSPALLATTLNQIGVEFLYAGKFEAAEPYLMEAFRMRRLSRDRDLRSSYLYLSRLRLAQGDIRSAAALIDAARSMQARDAGPPLWSVYYREGQIRRAEGRTGQAVALFRQALNSAKEWHEEAAPSDQSRTGTDVGLQGLYQSFVDATLELPEPPLAEAFVAAEEHRAASLRRAVLTTSTWHHKTTTGYWEKLAQLRASQAGLVAHETVQLRSKVEQLRFELNELEPKDTLSPTISHGGKTGENYYPKRALRDIQGRLGPGEALLSLYQGETNSYLWAVTRDSFEYHPLMETRALTGLAHRFRACVQNASADRDEVGQILYMELFGTLSQTVRRQSRWLLTADDALFDVPFAALVAARRGNQPVYLAEQHSMECVPTAFMLSKASSALPAGGFVGIGDGIYNNADPRWQRIAKSKPALQLARLVGSGQEVRSCAREWTEAIPPVLLTGAQASRQSLENALRSRPAVIHIAAHFLHPRDRPDEALIDLGLAGSGESEVLTREDIQNLNAPGAIVILSGCSSAAAKSVAGAGILGLARAWLIAGAAVVIGSRWPTPDDTGDFFQSFYRHLRTNLGGSFSARPVADALRAAQIEVIHSNTWRSNPDYWAAFYVVGRE